MIEHFGSWNAAKRQAGLVPRRFATHDELLQLLRQLGDELGRTPTAKDLDARKRTMPSKSLYWHAFGSLREALRHHGLREQDRGGNPDACRVPNEPSVRCHLSMSSSKSFVARGSFLRCNAPIAWRRRL